MRRILALMVSIGSLLVCASASAQTPPASPPAPGSAAEREFARLLDDYVAALKPLDTESRAAWWEANITGTDAAVARQKAANKALVDLHSDHARFGQLKRLREQGEVRDPVLRRELEVLYLAHLPGQADLDLQKKIVDLEAELEQVFNTHRSQVGGKMLTENDVREILATTADGTAAEQAWNAYMEIGQKADSRLRELVKLRNELARSLGFRDFVAMSLTLQELDEKELLRLFDELDEMTREPYAKWKAKIDEARAARFKIKPADLRPWHYGDLFFQELPQSGEVDYEALFKDADLVGMCRTYYQSIGLPADDILDRSDLYEKPGKCPHAFCHSMDRYSDVRVLANVKPNAYWADTVLHEVGHGVYDKYIGPDVPFVLRSPAHSMTTEGIAINFGYMCRNQEYLREVRKLPAEQARVAGQAAAAAMRDQRLMFARWAQVMLRFERGMYEQPDQDLPALWWSLKKQYQLENPPLRVDRPDYAAKNHILTTPVYYHNYMLGELFAAQVHDYIVREVLKDPTAKATSYYGRPAVGTYMREKIFGPGNLYPWNELTKRATGEPLTAKYFAAETVGTP